MIDKYGTNFTDHLTDGITSTSGNPTMAKQLLQQGLQEEGYSNVSALPTITYAYQANSPDAANEVAVEAQEWQSVLGINVKTEAVDFNKLVEEQFASNGNPIEGVGATSFASSSQFENNSWSW